MRNIIGLVAALGVASGGLAGAFAYDQLGSDAGAAPSATQVREQNLDGSGYIRMHEQGTANVNVIATPARSPDRLISLGTQTVGVGARYRSVFVDVTDCNKATVMATSSDTNSAFAVNPQMSPDGVRGISAIPATASGDVIDGVKTWSINNVQVLWPFMRIEAYT